MTADQPPDRPALDRHSRESGNLQSPRIVVTGTIGLDTVETPFGKVEAALGGSASYFALAASLYSSVSIVSVVGEDFPRWLSGATDPAPDWTFRAWRGSPDRPSAGADGTATTSTPEIRCLPISTY